MTSRTTSPAAICGYRSAMSQVQATATTPASHASALRAFEGRNAASRLPRNGRRTIRPSDIVNRSAAATQGSPGCRQTTRIGSCRTPRISLERFCFPFGLCSYSMLQQTRAAGPEAIQTSLWIRVRAKTSALVSNATDNRASVPSGTHTRLPDHNGRARLAHADSKLEAEHRDDRSEHTYEEGDRDAACRAAAHNSTAPTAPAKSDAPNTAILAATKSSKRGNAFAAMYSDIVKPMPASAAAPNNCSHEYAGDLDAIPRCTARRANASMPSGLPSTNPSTIAAISRSSPATMPADQATPAFASAKIGSTK